MRTKKQTQPGADASAAKSRTMPITLARIQDTFSSVTRTCLKVSCPGKRASTYPLKEAVLYLGRDPDCDIQLPLTSVSRKHASVRFVDEEYVVEDLDSTNGTFVNNFRIARCVLQNKDCLRLGEATVVFLQQHRVHPS